MSKPTDTSSHAAFATKLIAEAQELRNADRGLSDMGISLVDIATLLCHVKIAQALTRIAVVVEER